MFWWGIQPRLSLIHISIAGVLQRTLAKWGYEVCRTEEFENVMDEFLRFEPHLGPVSYTHRDGWANGLCHGPPAVYCKKF